LRAPAWRSVGRTRCIRQAGHRSLSGSAQSSIIACVSRRATIRPLRLDDAAALAELYARNREFLRPFEPDRDARFFTPGGQRARAELAIELAREGTLFRYVIADSESQIAGLIGLENVIRGASQSATLSYWVDRARNGRGLASQAVADIAELALTDLGLHRLEAPVRVDNPASQRLLEKNGFERVGIARGFLHVGGAWRDHILFQRLLH
jgi:ribosomal-protein-alanine N-acetyltransferase